MRGLTLRDPAFMPSKVSYNGVVVGDTPMMFVKPQGAFGSYTSWPSFATAVSNNIFIDTGTGGYTGPSYFRSWQTDSGNFPANYDTAVSTIGRFWDSDLDTLT